MSYRLIDNLERSMQMQFNHVTLLLIEFLCVIYLWMSVNVHFYLMCVAIKCISSLFT